MRQQGIVKDEAAVGPDVGQDEEDRGQDPVARVDEIHPGDRGYTQSKKHCKQLLFASRVVGKGPEDRREHGDDDHADRGRDGELTGCDLGLEPGTGDLRVVDREDGRDDRTDHRRVGPVVHRPRAELGPTQTKRVQGSGQPRFADRRPEILDGSVLHCVTPPRAAGTGKIRAAGAPLPLPIRCRWPGYRSGSRSDSRSRRPSPSDSRCQSSSSSQPCISGGMRRKASTYVLKTLHGWRSAR